jgi:hypothetical protein
MTLQYPLMPSAKQNDDPRSNPYDHWLDEAFTEDDAAKQDSPLLAVLKHYGASPDNC